MHYSNLVIIEKTDDVAAAVDAVMERHSEFWDWYQIGGRWTGIFDGYNPEDDPANIVECNLCNGTGKREDMEVANGCNGCKGTGKHPKWPTEWAQRAGDVVPVESLTEDQLAKFYRIVSHDYGVLGGERYIPWAETKFERNEYPPLDWLKSQHSGCLAVIVDNHN